jgi:signal transduction histidine kinase
MTDDSLGGPERARSDFAALIERDRPRILADFFRRLDAVGSPIARDAVARQQTLAQAEQTLTDVIASVRAGRVLVDEDYKLLAWEIGETRATNALPTRESWTVALMFVETVVNTVIRHVTAERQELFGVVLLTLNQSMTMRIREATGSYTSYLLNRIHEAHVGERHRIARELHDRVGNALSIAHRQLELFHAYREDEPVKAVNRAEKAHQAVVESMNSLRDVISGLRLEATPRSLEKALASYVDAVPVDDITLRLRINGDESWVPPAIGDETFLIIREAIRNALAHGHPTMVLIGVDIAPHELRAGIEDNGRGFDNVQTAKSDGAGLSSMRERAELLGGTVSIASRPYQGTSVELIVPLPGQREDSARRSDLETAAAPGARAAGAA